MVQRGEEKLQAKVTDVFSSDKKHFSLVNLAPRFAKLIEIGKRFENIYPILKEEHKVEKDEIEMALERIDEIYAPWKDEWGAGSPAEDVVDVAVKECARILDHSNSKHARILETLDTVALFMNSGEQVLDEIAERVSEKDKRIEFLEERCELLMSLKEVKEIDRSKYV